MSARIPGSWLALGALLTIGGALFLASQRHLERAIEPGALLLDGLMAGLNDVTELRLSDASGAGVTLRRGESGWRVV